MGTTVIGGMLAASVIGIFFIPAIFYVVEKVVGRGRRGLAPRLGRADPRRRREIDHARRVRHHSVCLAAVCSRGCTVGPNYQRPAMQMPPQFRAPEPLPPPQAASLGGSQVVRGFQGRKAAGSGPDGAGAELRPARRRGARRSGARQPGHHAVQPIPAISAPAANVSIDSPFARRRDCLCRPRSCPRRIAPSGQATLNLLSFEVDIWGRLRRATEAARANLLSAEENRKAVMTTLVSDVATAYLNLRELDYELEISQRTLATRQESLDLIKNRQTGGVATLLDLRQGEQLVYTAAETIPALQQQIEQTENQISLLLGKNPGDVVRGRSLTEQEMPPDVPAGLPSALLERRPDIRAAEQNLIAANAEIGVAKAAYFPQISLSGFLGGQSTQLVEPVQRAEQRLELHAASDAADLHRRPPEIEREAGARRSARARWSNIEKTDSDRLYRSLERADRPSTGAESREQQELLVAALQDRMRLAYVRYRGGVDTQLNALDADRDLFQAELTFRRSA